MLSCSSEATLTYMHFHIKLSGCPTKGHFTVKNTFLQLLEVKWPFVGQNLGKHFIPFNIHMSVVTVWFYADSSGAWVRKSKKLCWCDTTKFCLSWRLYWKYSLKYSLLTSNLVNRSGVSHGEKNGNPYEVLHDPVLVKYKTYLMLLVQNTIRFIPKCKWWAWNGREFSRT